MTMLLRDHFAVSAPVPLGDHAIGSAIADCGDGYLVITVAAPGAALPPSWMLTGGLWNDAAPWDDAASWED